MNKLASKVNFALLKDWEVVDLILCITYVISMKFQLKEVKIKTMVGLKGDSPSY